MNLRIERLYGILVFMLASCCISAPSPKSLNGNGTATQPKFSGQPSPVADWCRKGKEMPLGKWTEAGETMRVTYCEYDSTDGNGYKQTAGLDVRQQNLTTSQTVWKIHDETKIAMTSLKVFRPSFDMLDIDGDGKLETFFGYNLVSDGAEAIPVKFMAHMGGKKFAIRGSIPMTEDDSSSFKKEFDPAFASASARLKFVADSLFRRFAVRLCEDPDLGYGIPRSTAAAPVKGKARPLDLVRVSKFRLGGLLAFVLVVSCAKEARESVGQTKPAVHDSTRVRQILTNSEPNELRVDSISVMPGISVDSAKFATLDVADPMVLNEDVDSNGIRIRWWQHVGKGFQWVSTNLGTNSPDGPYWISQVSSDSGRCLLWDGLMRRTVIPENGRRYRIRAKEEWDGTDRFGSGRKSQVATSVDRDSSSLVGLKAELELT